MKLVDGWQNWWKWHSTYVFAVFAVFPTVWLASPDLQALLPPKIVSAVAPVVAVLGFLLRIRKQALPSVAPAPAAPPAP